MDAVVRGVERSVFCVGGLPAREERPPIDADIGATVGRVEDVINIEACVLRGMAPTLAADEAADVGSNGR